ncbi:hypothetical protein fugu_017257 [Takifugu bimaculatus]|uniref:Uncharacterized protein n=1 Tax=Takifugu bimaculatus TaxID=433685 RepID=A0A4Z2BS14_9TELE|nr:hypothetical protein fugu_017257 [Takifugu bimaculatus]
MGEEPTSKKKKVFNRQYHKSHLTYGYIPEAVRLMALKPRCMMGVGHQPQGYCRTPNPQTPGYLEVPSPQLNPQYNPQTPGTPAMYNTEQYSPYTAPSPQGSYQPSPSPQSYHQLAPSPVGDQNTHSPASYHPTPSPMAIRLVQAQVQWVTVQ